MQGMDVTEVMEALNETVVSGKARFVGCCNYPAWLVAHSNAIAERNGWARLACNQVAYNLIERGVEVEILPQAVAEQLAIMAYRPVADRPPGRGSTRDGHADAGRGAVRTDGRGLITWFSQHGVSVDRFNRFARDRGVHIRRPSPTAWVRYSAAITGPIVGVSSLRQLEGDRPRRRDQPDRRRIRSADRHVRHRGQRGKPAIFPPGIKYNFPRLRRNLQLLAPAPGD